MSQSLSQKEYLKKYLSSDDKLQKKKKKKKDKVPVKSSTVKIIDDDDYARFDPDPTIDEGELYALNEEAPVVVGVIDERAPEVMMKQEYKDSGKWKSLSSSKDKKKKKRRSPSVEIVKSKQEIIDLASRTSRRDSSDASPPRRRERKDSDASPPRQSRKRKDSSDVSPPRRRGRDSDESPPRQRKKQISPDNSPPRKHRRESPKNSKKDLSPPRQRRRSSDNTPPRRDRRSPERRRKSRWSPDRRDYSPQRRTVKIEKDSSPPRQVKREPDSPPRSTKMMKTLEGKAAGLQNAKDLKRENEEHRRRQDEMFRNMDPSISGRDAKKLNVRDARGRNKEYEKDYEKERKKAEAEEERQKQYDKWNRGVKQLEAMEKRRQEFIHEASKPLARAADDNDLEDHLKEQERLDDPMLEYMRSKKKKKDRKEGVLERPEYVGSYPDNRFHIKPGYRWDGVDRSNGYEKKYFEMLSSKISIQEEAYKYSVEDM